jgi:hypothetical protein
LTNIENIPGGFNYLSSMYHQLTEPLDSTSEESAAERGNRNIGMITYLEARNRRLAEQLGADQSEALPNPWAPPPPRQNQGILCEFINVLAPLGTGGFSPELMQSLFGMGNQNTPTMNPFLTSMTAHPPTTDPDAANPATPLINPFIPFFGSSMNETTNPMAEMIRQMQSTSIAASTTEPPIDPPEVRFAIQLEAMSDMGFTDQQKNIRALLASVIHSKFTYI